MLIVHCQIKQKDKVGNIMDNKIYSTMQNAPIPEPSIYYKLICIDEQHAIIAEQQLAGYACEAMLHPQSGQLMNAKTDKLKAKRLGRAVIVSIDKDNLEQKELAEVNYLLSSVRVHAMAYDDNEGLSQYDMEEVDKV